MLLLCILKLGTHHLRDVWHVQSIQTENQFPCLNLQVLQSLADHQPCQSFCLLVQNARFERNDVVDVFSYLSATPPFLYLAL